MNLQSYVCGGWRGGDGGVAMRDATTGEVIAQASSAGIDFAAVLSHARDVGGPALRALTFHERAALLKSLAKRLTEIKEEFYALSYRTGATKSDSMIDIDGGIGTVFVFASKGARELPNARIFVDGDVEGLSKGGSFVGQHVYVSREGAAVHINAFNFPVWGMLEKLAPTLLAGMPIIIKPATATAYLTELVVRRIIESKLLPEGSLQLICGGVGDLFEHLTCQDAVAFTGSASTAAKLRTHPAIVRNAVPFIAETDSLNSSILAADALPGTPEFELFIKEVVREMTVKAGQKCTAIRKALVPAAAAADVVRALQAALRKIAVGDPRAEGVRMGPLVSQEQRSDVLARVAELRRESDLVEGNMDTFEVTGADRTRGAFVPPLLLLSRDPRAARAVHEIEAFGPVATVLPYRDTADAIALARRGGGSLAASVFTADDSLAAQIVLGLAPYHGRILVVNRTCAKESTGHGSPLAPLVHGGPGRAGGGEEMGGIRGVLHYMQRTAVQGSPDTITAVSGRWVRGSRLRNPGRHPFRIPFHDLELGDTLQSAEREVTVSDIEQFAALSGDTFYAHMNESEAARNPLFGGRVAHGYFLISAAAGLFVDPEYGPVLGNYGLDALRFVKPVKPGDRIKVRLTCARKNLRADKGWGEVAWDTEITNQNQETVASYDVLTMVSVHAVPDSPGKRIVIAAIDAGRYSRDFPSLQFAATEAGILELVIANKGRLNAATESMHRDLALVWRTIDMDDAVRAVMVRGEGANFSSGGDFDMIERMIDDEATLVRVWKEASDLVYNLINCSKPVVSAIRGNAVGAGLAIALLADVSVAANDARILDGHTRLGVAAGDHAVIIWPLLCGLAKARYHLLMNKSLSGAEAERIGLVAVAVPDAEVIGAAFDAARTLAASSTTAIRWTKHALNNWLRLAGPSFDTSLALEFLGFKLADVREGLAAARDKRRPAFERKPE